MCTPSLQTQTVMTAFSTELQWIWVSLPCVAVRTAVIIFKSHLRGNYLTRWLLAHGCPRPHRDDTSHAS